MSSSFDPNLSFRFTEKEAAPLPNQGMEQQKLAKAKSRLHLFDYSGKENHDFFAIAAERIISKEKPPSLNPFTRFYNVIVKDSNLEGVYYKVNRASLQKRFNFKKEDLIPLIDDKGYINVEDFNKAIKEKLDPAFEHKAKELQGKLENYISNGVGKDELINILSTSDVKIVNKAFKHFIKDNSKDPKNEKCESLNNFLREDFPTTNRKKVRLRDDFRTLCREEYREKLQLDSESKSEFVASSFVAWFRGVEKEGKSFHTQDLERLLRTRSRFISEKGTVSPEEIKKQQRIIDSILDASEKNQKIDAPLLDLKIYLSSLFQELLYDNLHVPTENTYQHNLSSAISNFLTMAFEQVPEKMPEISHHLWEDMSAVLQTFFDRSFVHIPVGEKRLIIERIMDNFDSFMERKYEAAGGKKDEVEKKSFQETYFDFINKEENVPKLNLFDGVRFFKDIPPKDYEKRDYPFKVLTQVEPEALGIVFQYLPKDEWANAIKKIRTQYEWHSGEFIPRLNSIKKEMSAEDLKEYFSKTQ